MATKQSALDPSPKESSVDDSVHSSSSNLTTPNSANEITSQTAPSTFFRRKTGSMGEKMDKASAVARAAARAAARLESKGQRKSVEESEDKKPSAGVGKGSEMRRRATTTSDMPNVKAVGRLSGGRGVQGTVTDRSVRGSIVTGPGVGIISRRSQ